MEINITIEDPKMVAQVAEAFAIEHGYLETVPNPKPQPVLSSEAVSPEEQAAFDSWTPEIPNPVSKEEFVRVCLIGIIKDKVTRWQAGQHASNPETIAALDQSIK